MSVSEYELVLMLDPETPDERRDAIAADARTRIEKGGSLSTEKAWGMRKLAYEIKQRTEADYRFFRFATESPLLDELGHNLKITDGVLRFRIFKVDPDSPVIEPPPPVSLASSAPSRGPGGRRGGRDRDDYADSAPPREQRSERPAPAGEPASEAAAPASEAAAPAPEAPAAADPPAPSEPATAPAGEPPAEQSTTPPAESPADPG